MCRGMSDRLCWARAETVSHSTPWPRITIAKWGQSICVWFACVMERCCARRQQLHFQIRSPRWLDRGPSARAGAAIWCTASRSRYSREYHSSDLGCYGLVWLVLPRTRHHHRESGELFELGYDTARMAEWNATSHQIG